MLYPLSYRDVLEEEETPGRSSGPVGPYLRPDPSSLPLSCLKAGSSEVPHRPLEIGGGVGFEPLGPGPSSPFVSRDTFPPSRIRTAGCPGCFPQHRSDHVVKVVEERGVDFYHLEGQASGASGTPSPHIILPSGRFL